MAARSYALIHSTILASDLTEQSLGAQLLYLQLLARPERNKVGLIMYRPRSWVKSLPGLTVADVEDLVAELEDADLLVVDRDTLEVVHRTHMHHDGVLKMSQVLISAAKERPAVESDIIGAAIDEQIPPQLRDRWPHVIARTGRETVQEWIKECDAGSYKPPRRATATPTGRATSTPPTTPTEAQGKGSDHPDGSLPEGEQEGQRYPQGRGRGTGEGEGSRSSAVQESSARARAALRAVGDRGDR